MDPKNIDTADFQFEIEPEELEERVAPWWGMETVFPF
jgi:hypothetical protein